MGRQVIKISSYGFSNAAIDNKGYLYTWGEKLKKKIKKIRINYYKV